MFGHRLRLFFTGTAVALTFIGLSPAGASSANISHSYNSNQDIQVGSLVSLDPNQSNYVEASNTNNGTQLLGIAVATDDSLLAIDAGSGKVQVATSGTADALVSTLNGNINVGDEIAVSPFNGIGMKATAGSHVIGLAQTSFNQSTSGSSNQTVTDKTGHTNHIVVGFVRLGIGIGTAASVGGANQLSALQKLGKGLTGHLVPTSRIVISIVIAVVAFLALITLIYASIYGGIISIGRNPLAKTAIFRTIGSVLGMVIVVAIVASVTIFFLLH